MNLSKVILTNLIENDSLMYKEELSLNYFRGVVILAGDNLSGKTRTLRVLKAINVLINENNALPKVSDTIVFKSYLFGNSDVNTLKRDWTKPLIVNIIFEDSSYLKIYLTKDSSDSLKVSEVESTIPSENLIEILDVLKNIYYIASSSSYSHSDHTLKDCSINSIGRCSENLLNYLEKDTKLTEDDTTITSFLGLKYYPMTYSMLSNIFILTNWIMTGREIVYDSSPFAESPRWFNGMFQANSSRMVLHLVTVCLLAARNQIILIENPENYLKDSAQARLIKFLIYEANKKELKLVIETNSENILYGSRIAIVKGFSCKKVSVYRFSLYEPPHEILLDSEGKSDTEYDDLFNQTNQDLNTLLGI